MSNKTDNIIYTSMLAVLNVRPQYRMLPLVSHGEYIEGTDRQTDGRQTVTLAFRYMRTALLGIVLVVSSFMMA